MKSRSVALLFVSLAACAAPDLALAQARPKPQAEQKPAQPPKEEKTFPKDSNWTLRTMNGKPLPAGVEATLRIDGQFRGSGFSGCNTWSATMWPVRAQHFAVGPVALTKKQCDAQKMTFEHTYLSILHNQSSWDLVGGLLEVKSGSGTLAFARGF
jgi:heat shock protein HslJ